MADQWNPIVGTTSYCNGYIDGDYPVTWDGTGTGNRKNNGGCTWESPGRFRDLAFQA